MRKRPRINGVKGLLEKYKDKKRTPKQSRMVISEVRRFLAIMDIKPTRENMQAFSDRVLVVPDRVFNGLKLVSDHGINVDMICDVKQKIIFAPESAFASRGFRNVLRHELMHLVTDHSETIPTALQARENYEANPGRLKGDLAAFRRAGKEAGDKIKAYDSGLIVDSSGRAVNPPASLLRARKGIRQTRVGAEAASMIADFRRSHGRQAARRFLQLLAFAKPDTHKALRALEKEFKTHLEKTLKGKT